MKVALIGYGYWGKILERYLDRNMHFNLVKIYSPSLEENGFYTNDIDAIMEDAKIKAVFIATPIDTHFHYVKLALIHDKHVFCEKPLCSINDNIAELIQLKESTDKIIYTDYIYNVSDSIKEMKKQMHNIGEIKYIQCDIRQFGNFYENDDVYDVLSVHFSALLINLFSLSQQSDVKVQYHDVLKDEKNCPIIGTIDFLIKNKTIGQIHSNLVSTLKERKVEIIGEKGSLTFNMLEEYTLKLYRYHDYKNTQSMSLLNQWKFDENNNIDKSLNDFYSSIQFKKDNFALAICVQKILNQKQIKV